MDNSKLQALIQKTTMLNPRKLSYLKDTTVQLIQSKVIGDIVECGVWMGGSVALMAQTLLKYHDPRVLRLFDSFDDICEPSAVDGSFLTAQVGGIEHAQGRLRPVPGFYRKVGRAGPGNSKAVFNLLTNIVGYPKERVKIYKGWFQETLPKYNTRIDKIALLFLDCDLYESTKVCLEYLYKKVVHNGFILVDDYHAYPGCKKAVDDYLTSQKSTVTIRPGANTGCVYWRKE